MTDKDEEPLFADTAEEDHAKYLHEDEHSPLCIDCENELEFYEEEICLDCEARRQAEYGNDQFL